MVVRSTAPPGAGHRPTLPEPLAGMDPGSGILAPSSAPWPAAVTLSDKLFYWVFQNHPDRILELQPDLAQAPGGYRFSAPAL